MASLDGNYTQLRASPDKESIFLGAYDNFSQYAHTLERIKALLSDESKIGRVVQGKLEIEDRTRADKAWAMFRLNGAEQRAVRNGVEKLVEQNQKWNPKVQNAVSALLGIPALKADGQVAENIQFFCEPPTPQEDPNKPAEADRKKLRKDALSADVFFLFGKTRVPAHKSVLRDIPYFAKAFESVSDAQPYGEDLSEVADPVTVQLFLDVLYGTVELALFPFEEQLGKFQRLSEHLKDERIMEKVLDLLAEKFDGGKVPLTKQLFRTLISLPWKYIPYHLFAWMFIRVEASGDCWFYNTLESLWDKKAPNPLILTLIGACTNALVEASRANSSPDSDHYKKFSYRHYKWAAELDWPPGLLQYGLCYAHGRGVEADIKVALGHITKAADLGSAGALITLGKYYDLTGHFSGVTPNLEKALECYRRALTFKCTTSQKKFLQNKIKEIGKLIESEERRFKEEAEKKEQAIKDAVNKAAVEAVAEVLSSEKMVLLGKKYEAKGDLSLALCYYQKAASMGNEEAQLKADALS